MFNRLGQQTRNKGIQPLPPQALHGTQLRAAAQAGQGFEGFGRVGKATFLQLQASGVFVLRLFPQWQPLAAYDQLTLCAFFFVRVGDDLAEVPVHPTTPIHQALMERGPIGKAQHKGNTRLIFRGVREHLRLAVGDRLDRMLGVTQEFVAVA